MTNISQTEEKYYFSNTNRHCKGALHSSGGSFRKQILLSWMTTSFLLPHFKTSKFAVQLDGNGATDRQAHTLQAFIGSIDARPHTHSHSLYSPGLLLCLTLIGPHFQPATACFSFHCTRSGVTNHRQSNQGWGGGGLEVSSFFLSLCPPLPSPPCVFPSTSSPPPPSPSLIYFRSSILLVSGVRSDWRHCKKKSPFGSWRVSDSGDQFGRVHCRVRKVGDQG